MSNETKMLIASMESMTQEERHDCALYVIAYADALNKLKNIKADRESA